MLSADAAGVRREGDVTVRTAAKGQTLGWNVPGRALRTLQRDDAVLGQCGLRFSIVLGAHILRFTHNVWLRNWLAARRLRNPRPLLSAPQQGKEDQAGGNGHGSGNQSYPKDVRTAALRLRLLKKIVNAGVG